MADTKTLIVFYSRTGTTRKVAELIAERLECDTEEITTPTSRAGFWGYLKCGYEAAFKKTAVINNIKSDPGAYDLVIIGTPVWAGTMASPIRTYIMQCKAQFKNVALFCACQGSGGTKALHDMQDLCGKEALAMVDITASDVARGDHTGGIEQFVYEIIEKSE